MTAPELKLRLPGAMHERLELLASRRGQPLEDAALAVLELGLDKDSTRLKSTHRIRVTIAPGPVPKLRRVSFTVGDRPLALHVSAEHVNESEGTMRIYVLDEQDGNLHVQLLGEPQGSAGLWILGHRPQVLWLSVPREMVLGLPLESGRDG